MGKTTPPPKTNSITSQKTRKSDSSITKQSSASATQRRGNGNSNSTQRAIAWTVQDKENATNHTKPSSDISDDETMESGTAVYKKPRKSSAVHEYAEKFSPNEYQCKICAKIIRCTVDTNSNIRRHLALNHGKVQLACKSHRSSRMTISLEKRKRFDEAALNCIITDTRCWNDFKRPGMASFLSIVVPGYIGPSSRTVQRRLAKLYLQKQHDFKNELNEVENVSITTDLWQSARSHHYLCITVHWLNSKYQTNAKVLNFRKFKGRHLSIRIRRHIKRVLDDFNLINKIVATTTDNGSNVKAATSQVRLFGIRLHCMAHALNLTIHKGLHLWAKKNSTLQQNSSSQNENEPVDSNDDASDDDVLNEPDEEPNESNCNSDEEDEAEEFDQDDDSSSSSTDAEDDESDSSSATLMNGITNLMERCRSIVVTIRKSSILHEFIQTLADESSIKAGLIIDMRVRWNSTFKMLQRIILYQSILNKLYEQLDSLAGVTGLQRKKLLNAKLTGNDWTLAQVLRRVLERFDDATRVLSGQRYPTLSFSYAITFSLLHYLNSQSVDNLENQVKALLLNSYNQYMIRDGKEMAVIRVAALLDPVIHDLLTPEDKHAAESFIAKEINEKRRSNSTLTSVTSVTTSNTNTDTSTQSTTLPLGNLSKSSSVIHSFLNKCGVKPPPK
ncbi:unnamed protein product [Adineta ricciae]|uniref:BED-type domain-containing protein n=1 Tax=Adineta ricciae TaxID=249248 RepID=A0A815QER0_ADIRI|nr:unnamed protein product [Adineta ricciae]